jgi:hypothetical protein
VGTVVAERDRGVTVQDVPAASPSSGVRHRLTSLAVLELLSVVLLPLAVFALPEVPLTWANVAGTVPAVVLLVQGGIYWWLKLRQLDAGAPRPAGLGAYRHLRWANWLVLAGTAVPIVLGLLEAPGRAAVPGALFWLLGLAEQVNYFYVQLMHDTVADLRRLFRTGLRRSHLSRDLAGR